MGRNAALGSQSWWRVSVKASGFFCAVFNVLSGLAPSVPVPGFRIGAVGASAGKAVKLKSGS